MHVSRTALTRMRRKELAVDTAWTTCLDDWTSPWSSELGPGGTMSVAEIESIDDELFSERYLLDP